VGFRVEYKSHNPQESAASRAEGRGHLVCQLQELSLNGGVSVAGKMRYIVNLYQFNKRNSVVLSDIESSYRNHHSQNYIEARKHPVFSCSPSQYTLLKRASICFASVSGSGKSPSYFSLVVRLVGEERIKIKGEDRGRNRGWTYSSTWL